MLGVVGATKENGDEASTDWRLPVWRVPVRDYRAANPHLHLPLHCVSEADWQRLLVGSPGRG